MSDLSGVPAHLVMKMLERGSEVAIQTSANAMRYAESRNILRTALIEGLAKPTEAGVYEVTSDMLAEAPASQVSAVDGAVICDSRSIGDLCTAVAIALGDTEENSESKVFMEQVPRAVGNKELTTGIMHSMEIDVASRATGDIVLMDGSLFSALIATSKAISNADKGDPDHALVAATRAIRRPEFVEQVLYLLSSKKHIGMPKYVTTNQFAEYVPDPFKALDARSVATMALRPGEATRFFDFSKDREAVLDRSLMNKAFGLDDMSQKLLTSKLSGMFSCYYKPHPWTQAFRIDISADAYLDDEAKARILRAVHDQTMASGMQEPLPQYLVDQFAKQISVGASAVVEMSALSSTLDPEAQMLIALGYRT